MSGDADGNPSSVWWWINHYYFISSVAIQNSQVLQLFHPASFIPSFTVQERRKMQTPHKFISLTQKEYHPNRTFEEENVLQWYWTFWQWSVYVIQNLIVPVQHEDRDSRAMSEVIHIPLCWDIFWGLVQKSRLCMQAEVVTVVTATNRNTLHTPWGMWGMFLILVS